MHGLAMARLSSIGRAMAQIGKGIARRRNARRCKGVAMR
nr:MAG TPA: hypothetical protein [Caudoviricetes sp.]